MLKPNQEKKVAEFKKLLQTPLKTVDEKPVYRAFNEAQKLCRITFALIKDAKLAELKEFTNIDKYRGIQKYLGWVIAEGVRKGEFIKIHHVKPNLSAR